MPQHRHCGCVAARGSGGALMSALSRCACVCACQRASVQVRREHRAAAEAVDASIDNLCKARARASAFMHVHARTQTCATLAALVSPEVLEDRFRIFFSGSTRRAPLAHMPPRLAGPHCLRRWPRRPHQVRRGGPAHGGGVGGIGSHGPLPASRRQQSEEGLPPQEQGFFLRRRISCA